MKVLSVNLARASRREIDGQQVLTAIGKQPARGPVAVGPAGLDGDEQADPTVHGGLAKAVYAYPAEHHGFWQTVRAQAGVAAATDPIPAGLFGENLTIEGLLERDAWIGDTLCFPDCEIAISEPRFPCFKFNAAMGFRHAVKMMAESGWCGFYLAVRRPGMIRAGETYTIDPGPREVGVAELFRARMRKG